MKKFLVFAMVLVSACMLFADTLPIQNKTMKVTLTIGEQSFAKWAEKADSQVQGESESDIWAGMGEYTEPQEIISTLSVYPSVKTNNAKQVKMTVTGQALNQNGKTPVIKLTATGVDAGEGGSDTVVEWDSVNDEEKIVWTEIEDDLKKGNRIISHQLDLELDDVSYADALAGTYTATLTLDVSVVE